LQATMIDINKTAKRNAKIVLSPIAAHALSGYDSVPKMFGIGKRKQLWHRQTMLTTFM